MVLVLTPLKEARLPIVPLLLERTVSTLIS